MIVGVVGSGVMGTGIVELLISNGFKIVWKSTSIHRLNERYENLNKVVLKKINRGKYCAEKVSESQLSIKLTEDYADLAGCGLVIEAVSEDKVIKDKVLSQVSRHVASDTIIASNTSSFFIDELAKNITFPERFLGTHFFNPAAIMLLAEVILGKETSNETYISTKEFLDGLGKSPIKVNDSSGFVVNRLLMPMINEAVATLHEGVAERESIDAAMQLGANHPMGPLKLADLIGIDVVVAILESMYSATMIEKYRPHELLIELVKDGRLGKKSGDGFYQY